MKFNFPCPEIKFYCNATTLIYLCVVYGCFYAVKVEWLQ